MSRDAELYLLHVVEQAEARQEAAERMAAEMDADLARVARKAADAMRAAQRRTHPSTAWYEAMRRQKKTDS